MLLLPILVTPNFSMTNFSSKKERRKQTSKIGIRENRRR